MSKKICFVTGSRAEYGLLLPLIRKVNGEKAFKRQIIACGMHLLKEFGSTYREIEKDFRIDRKISLGSLGGDEKQMAQAVSQGIKGFTQAYGALKPDAVVVLGDRFEILAAAVAAFFLKIPIVHIHGGEATEGALDDGIRHSITKMSSLHFTSTEAYRKRVIQLGEEPSRVFNTGSLGVENINSMELMSKSDILRYLELRNGEKFVVVTFHPVTMAEDGGVSELKALLSALKGLRRIHVIFTKPNADPKGRLFIRMINDFAAKNSGVSIFDSMGALRYLSAMKYSEAVVGNSSSGIIEAPSLNVPSVNIGQRQKGRLRASSVIDCSPNAVSIGSALRRALSPAFRKKSAKVKNPYYIAGTSRKMLEILTKKAGGLNTAKSFYDLRGGR